MSCHPHHDIRCFRALIPCESSSLSNSYRRLATNLRIQASVGCFPRFSWTDVKIWWFQNTTINKHIFLAGNLWQLWPYQASLAERIVEEYAQEASWKTKKQKPTPQVDVADTCVTWVNSLNINTYHPVIWVFSRRLVQSSDPWIHWYDIRCLTFEACACWLHGTRFPHEQCLAGLQITRGPEMLISSR